ncbi:hypothetical protein KJ972_00955 [Candidatus Micrarchaeota archaeon]|nr:hypothetical protein [Candidatus Micrarchaeota archaeon]
MNSKGQGSGVFQLLIAAVVALAILGVLLGIIGGLPPLGSQDPIEASRNGLKDAFTQVGSPQFSSKVTITKDTVFTPRGVAPRELGISIDHVCVGVAKALGDSFSITDEFTPDAIVYSGSRSLDVKIGAICETGDDIDAAANDVFQGAIDDFDNDCEDNGSSETYCVVAILPP